MLIILSGWKKRYISGINVLLIISIQVGLTFLSGISRFLKFKLHSYFEINILRHIVHRVFHWKMLTNLHRKHWYLYNFPIFFSYFHKWNNLGEIYLKAWFVANTKNVNFYVNINFMCIIFIRISLKFKNIGNESLRNIWLSEENFILFIFILFHWNI